MSYNNSAREADEYNKSAKKDEYSSRLQKLSPPDRNSKSDTHSKSENHYHKSSSSLKEKSHHKRSKHQKRRHDEYDRELHRDRGRYRNQHSYTDRHRHRSSTSNNKHRYEKATNNLTELSNKAIEIEDEFHLHKYKRLKTIIDYKPPDNWETETVEQGEMHEYNKVQMLNTGEMPSIQERNSDTITGSETSENEAESNKIDNIKAEHFAQVNHLGYSSKDASPELQEEVESEDDLIEPLDQEVLVHDNTEELEDLPPYYPAIQGCRSVNEFQLLNHINEGTYGIVYRARDKHNNDIVALKRLKMEKEKEGFPITSLREINTLLKGQHPNIVTVREIVVGNNMDKIFIVMDYLEHDLKSLIEVMRSKKQSFTAAEVKCLLKQLMCAIAYLHDNWILHRDLKTSNLLLSQNGLLKVGDFGLAREYGSPLKPYTPIVVTLWYRAPELLLGIKPYSTSVDVWSCGCIFGELALMNPVFPGKSEIDELNRIFKLLSTPNKNTWPGFNKLPTVQRIKLVQYPNNKLSQRFNMLSVQGQALLQQLLTCDPSQRINAEDAFNHSYFKEFPLALDPSSFPSWPTKSDIGRIHPDDVKKDDGGFHINASAMDNRKLPVGGGFNLKF
ncbi:cyclin-dependent kinase 11B-like isoform X2 [Photinus pyralis]|uniref:cyclin-dependent kinase 11B-like isoform X2 n=1 Tax=Photinus pyralis TaxID=7054 RepID=UPI0012670E05|nr:cyclin-dependent kinase 11B-like isoform X2 [Photinus pyralis]